METSGKEQTKNCFLKGSSLDDDIDGVASADCFLWICVASGCAVPGFETLGLRRMASGEIRDKRRREEQI